MSGPIFTIANTTPSFALRKVDPGEVMMMYHSGAFVNQKKPSSKIDIKSAPVISTVDQKYDPTSSTYTCRNKNNLVVTFTGSNHRNFEIFNKNKVVMGGRCEWCRLIFTCEVIGCAVAYKFEELLDEEIKQVHTFWTEGTFCHPRCCLAHIQAFGLGRKDPFYINAERYLRFMYHLSNPGEELMPSQDYRLLIENGGTLSKEDFFNGNIHYTRSSNVLLIPAKVEYIRD